MSRTVAVREVSPPTRSRRRIAVTAAVLFALALVAACGAGDRGGELRGDAPRAPSTSADAEDAAASTRYLTGPLLASLAGGGANVAISPWTVADQLALLRSGAGGTTREALDQALGTVGVDDVDLLLSVGALADALAARNGDERSEDRLGTIELLPATSLWSQRGIAVDPAWLDQLAAGTGDGVRTVDFRSDPEGARGAINDWARGATDGTIDEPLPRGSITADSRLVGASALWLQAPWDRPFPGVATDLRPFHLPDGTTVDVPTMQLRATTGLRWGTHDGIEVVELPYLGRDLRLVAILPPDGGLPPLLGGLDPTRIDQLLDALAPEALTLSLPRWAFTTRVDLGPTLTTIGLGVLLDPDAADLSGLAPNESLALSDAHTEVFTSVDEEGTQTSAATVERIPDTIAPGTPEVVVDRPFAFLVIDAPTEAVVLAGVVTDPRA